MPFFHISNFLSHTCVFFPVETNSEEAWQIGVRLSGLLETRPSPLHTHVYQHSQAAGRRPHVAFEIAFGLPPAPSMEPLSPGIALKETSKASWLPAAMQRQLSTTTASVKEGEMQSTTNTVGAKKKGGGTRKIASTAGAVLSRMLSRQD